MANVAIFHSTLTEKPSMTVLLLGDKIKEPGAHLQSNIILNGDFVNKTLINTATVNLSPLVNFTFNQYT